MRRKIVCIIILILLFVLFLIFLHPKEKEYYVREVISPTEFILDNGEIFKVKVWKVLTRISAQEIKSLLQNLT